MFTTDGRRIRLIICLKQAIIALAQMILALFLTKRTLFDPWIAGTTGLTNFIISLYLIGWKTVYIYHELSASVLRAFCCGIICNILSIIILLFNGAKYAGADLSKHLLFGSSEAPDHAFAVFFYLTVYTTCIMLIGLATYALINEFDPEEPFKGPDTETPASPGKITRHEDLKKNVIEIPDAAQHKLRAFFLEKPATTSTPRKESAQIDDDIDSDSSDFDDCISADFSTRYRGDRPQPNAPNKSAITMTPPAVVYESANHSPEVSGPHDTPETSEIRRHSGPEGHLIPKHLLMHQGSLRRKSIHHKEEMTIIREVEEVTESDDSNSICTRSERDTFRGKKIPPPLPPKPVIIKRTEHWESIETTDPENFTLPGSPSFLNDIKSFNRAKLRRTNRRLSSGR